MLQTGFVELCRDEKSVECNHEEKSKIKFPISSVYSYICENVNPK